jgi:predicted nucleic acid-binding protein
LIVFDASAAVLALANEGDARDLLGSEAVAIPHLADSEVAQAIRARVRRGELDVTQGSKALEVWAQLGLRRFPAVGLLRRVWELRDNMTSYDATYVALAEALGVAVVTADLRLASAAGPRCPITVVRR